MIVSRIFKIFTIFAVFEQTLEEVMLLRGDTSSPLRCTTLEEVLFLRGYISSPLGCTTLEEVMFLRGTSPLPCAVLPCKGTPPLLYVVPTLGYNLLSKLTYFCEFAALPVDFRIAQNMDHLNFILLVDGFE